MTQRRSKGEGTIFWSDTLHRWVAQLTLPNGKKKTKKSKTQGEVKKWLLEQRKTVEDHTYLEGKDISLDKFLDRYLEEVGRHTLRPKTIESYTYVIEKHIKPALGRRRLTEIRPDHLQKLYSEKMDAGLSNRTVLYIYQILHKVFRQAMQWGLLNRNVTEMTQPPANKRKAVACLSEADSNRFLAHVQDDRLYPLYLLAITTGLRRGELLGLHWPEVHLNKRVVQVKQALQEQRGKGLVLVQPKTEKSRRTVPMPSVTAAALQRLHENEPGSKGLVFHTGNNTPFSQRNLLRHYHQQLEELGMPRMRFHALRHTFASLMLAKNVHPKVVQEMLGHSTITLTLDTYSHMIPEIQREASDKLNEVFKGLEENLEEESGKDSQEPPTEDSTEETQALEDDPEKLHS